MTVDRISGVSLGLAVAGHAGLAILLGTMALRLPAPPATPLLIEVTLAGTSAPRSLTEGVKEKGTVIAPRGDKADQPPVLTEEQERVWKAHRRRQMIQELARSRSRVRIGATAQELKEAGGGLAEGRGAGDLGQPGSSLGTLSLTGAIATRGYREPDFSQLKTYITEETLLRITLLVQPGGEVKRAVLLETSGYPYVDQKALEIARKILFDPLPANWQQTDQEGVLTIKLKL